MVFAEIENNKIRSVIRGHLLSINKKPINLKIYGHELFRTNDCTIIITLDDISFKQKSRQVRFKFNKIAEFYLKDCQTFVFLLDGEKKRKFYTIS